ncbi:hypothetical protein K0M31_011243 [Melipona bicolor]|uniref:Uncharacterized protein n=1 Tax=Melipona bicolor TaxID=60889 RepID=A0AA40KUL1_9HYME|nr:hypothetical protein K0M31_011243 [Melipona bicolor]
MESTVRHLCTTPESVQEVSFSRNESRCPGHKNERAQDETMEDVTRRISKWVTDENPDERILSRTRTHVLSRSVSSFLIPAEISLYEKLSIIFARPREEEDRKKKRRKRDR